MKRLIKPLILGITILVGISCSTIKDIDGNKYNVVKIGEQRWIGENLKTTKNSDNTQIPLVTNDTEWINQYTPAYCWYNNDSVTYAQIYGALYNWHTVETGKLCPSGWHVPTDEDWKLLMDYVGGDDVAGSKLKEMGNSHWTDSNSDATNENGFTALPGGYRATNGKFLHMGIKGHWWTSTSFSYTHAVKKDINDENGIVNSGNGNKSRGGVSIRCIKD